MKWTVEELKTYLDSIIMENVSSVVKRHSILNFCMGNLEIEITGPDDVGQLSQSHNRVRNEFSCASQSRRKQIESQLPKPLSQR